MNLPVEDNAIVCRDVCKTFGSRQSTSQVLRNVDITVPKGTIYALLGPSGCGKTTLLRCILGRLTINEGTILVYDEPPTIKNKPNTTKIGYMPQDIALTQELTGDETLQLFGKIYKMGNKEIKEKCEFLVEFLEMPFYKREIRKLSDGQKRRISFAVALIHEPEILILDEPTVGVDPPLRKSIWEYLYKIAETRNATIIVTTHYIEEAHMAHNVGLMLNGSMVEQGEPDQLIEKYGCQNLEKVFLKLCLQCENEEIENTNEKDPEKGNNLQVVDMDMHEDPKSSKKSVEKLRKDYKKPQAINYFNFQLPSSHRIWALFLKDFWLITRNPTMMWGIFIIPAIIMVLFSICIGKPLRDLPLGIVNHDAMNFSQLYLESIDNSLIKQVHYKEYSKAFQDAKNGKIWGILSLDSNFTESVIEKYSKFPLVEDVTLNNSLISVAMDFSNKNVEIIINLELLKSYRKFLQVVCQQLGLNTMMADLPVKFAPRQVYGSIELNIADYYYPSFMLQMTYYVIMAGTAVTLNVAKQSGNLDRLYISGVEFLEVAFGQILSQIFFMVSQTILLFITVFGILRYSCAGLHILAFLMSIVQGFCGITLGVLLASICETQTMTIVSCMAVFLLCSTMNTFLWPLEGVSYPVRVICLMSPQNYAFEAFRSIIIRGWGITHRTVIAGFTIPFVWAAIFIIVSMVAFRLKS